MRPIASITLLLCSVLLSACATEAERQQQTAELEKMRAALLEDVNFQEWQFRSSSHPDLGELEARSMSGLTLRGSRRAKGAGHMITLSRADGAAFPKLPEAEEEKQLVDIVSEFAAQRYCGSSGVDSIERVQTGAPLAIRKPKSRTMMVYCVQQT